MTLTRLAAAIGLFGALAACADTPPRAYGDANSVIVIAPDALWAEIGDEVERALAPRVFTIRDERTFQLTQVAPEAPELRRLRLFAQLLVVGEADSPWVEPVLSGQKAADAGRSYVVERDDIWVRGQKVTALVVPPGGGADEIREALPVLHEILDARFRAYAGERMFVSGRNEALRDRLRGSAGFSLLLPNVYREVVEDSAYLFRNDQAVAGDLIRSVLVTWREGAAPSTVAEALEWRDAVAARYYARSQVTERERIESRALDGAGIEAQGVWSAAPGEWPAAGPFVTRAIACPDAGRTYLLDAWLYAPGKDKYEYMIQLETILDSFECAAPPAQ